MVLGIPQIKNGERVRGTAAFHACTSKLYVHYGMFGSSLGVESLEAAVDLGENPAGKIFLHVLKPKIQLDD